MPTWALSGDIVARVADVAQLREGRPLTSVVDSSGVISVDNASFSEASSEAGSPFFQKAEELIQEELGKKASTVDLDAQVEAAKRDLGAQISEASGTLEKQLEGQVAKLTGIIGSATSGLQVQVDEAKARNGELTEKIDGVDKRLETATKGIEETMDSLSGSIGTTRTDLSKQISESAANANQELVAAKEELHASVDKVTESLDSEKAKLEKKIDEFAEKTEQEAKTKYTTTMAGLERLEGQIKSVAQQFDEMQEDEVRHRSNQHEKAKQRKAERDEIWATVPKSIA